MGRGKFGDTKNKVSYAWGCVYNFCYMSNVQYDIDIVQHSFIHRNAWCKRSYLLSNYDAGKLILMDEVPGFDFYFLESYANKSPPLHQPYFSLHLE